jgi:hypothetical protein
MSGNSIVFNGITKTKKVTINGLAVATVKATPKAKVAPKVKRIPEGAWVKYKAQDADPKFNVGYVVRFVPKGKKMHKAHISDKVVVVSIYDRYVVKVGGVFKAPIAGRVEKQNSKSLRLVK